MSAIIRPLTEADLPAARRIVNTAFGTFLGAPDPENFWADRDLVYGRFGAEHVASFAAELDSWDTSHTGLFTFPQSPLHLALYGKFGFHARFLTAIMAAPAQSAGNP